MAGYRPNLNLISLIYVIRNCCPGNHCGRQVVKRNVFFTACCSSIHWSKLEHGDSNVSTFSIPYTYITVWQLLVLLGEKNPTHSPRQTGVEYGRVELRD